MSFDAARRVLGSAEAKVGVNPVGYCRCGCGERTKLAPYTDRGKGWIKGQPVRFLHNHHRGTVRLDAYVEQDGPLDTACWVLNKAPTERGYVQVRIDGEQRLAHRASYERHRGPIPAGLQIDHLCRVRRCINPAHLEPVTNKENVERGIRARTT